MNTKQIQNLLAYLGYYVGNIDGIWGAGSKTACKAFQKDFALDADGIAGDATQKALKHSVCYGIEKQETTEEIPTVSETETVTGTFWDEIKYFSREEFRCKCGGKYCNGFPAEPEEKLIRAAEKTREYFDRPMTISSGLRCPTHNANSGGVYNSRHLSGKAMDFSVRGFSASSVLAYVQHLSEIRYAYAIDSNWVHMDIL